MHNGPDSSDPSTPTTLASFWETHKNEALHYSVSRLGPADIGGLPAQGLLYIGDQPMSEEWIKERYGGGTFIARVYTLADNWESSFDFEIPGEPKAVYPFRFFHSDAGEPVEIPGMPPEVPEEDPGAPEQVSEADMEKAAFQQALQNLLAGFGQMISIVRSQKSRSICGDCASGEEDEDEPRSAIPVAPYDIAETVFGEQAEAKELETQRHSLSLGMSIGAALTAAGVNAMSQDFLWLTRRMVKSFGRTLNSRRSKFQPCMAQTHVPRGGIVFEEPSVPPPPNSPESVKENDPQRAVDIKKKLESLKEQAAEHGDIDDIFAHFEELFGQFYPGFKESQDKK